MLERDDSHVWGAAPVRPKPISDYKTTKVQLRRAFGSKLSIIHIRN